MGKTSGNNRQSRQKKTWKGDRIISIRKVGKKMPYAQKFIKYGALTSKAQKKIER